MLNIVYLILIKKVYKKVYKSILLYIKYNVIILNILVTKGISDLLSLSSAKSLMFHLTFQYYTLLNPCSNFKFAFAKSFLYWDRKISKVSSCLG